MATHRLLLGVLVVVALSGGTAIGSAKDVPAGAATPTVNASVQRGSYLRNTGCSLSRALQVIQEFLDAFNRGEVAELPGFFPTEGVYPYSDKRGFQWYSVTDVEGHHVIFDPAELPAYFVARHKQHERRQLLELEVNGGDGKIVGLIFRLQRSADDRSPREMMGKGAFYCDDETIFVWSMGHDMPVPESGAVFE